MTMKRRTKTRTAARYSFRISKNMSVLLSREFVSQGPPIKGNLGLLQLNFVAVAIIYIGYDSTTH